MFIYLCDFYLFTYYISHSIDIWKHVMQQMCSFVSSKACTVSRRSLRMHVMAQASILAEEESCALNSISSFRSYYILEIESVIFLMRPPLWSSG
jgi:hypothetical protein